jgi:hypothetical protein
MVLRRQKSTLPLAFAVAVFTYGADGPALRAGFAEADITPAIGMEQPGGYGKAYHQNAHDPCKVRAAVFDDGRMRVAMVGIDALIVRRPLVEAARAAIEKECGIPPGAVMIAASHSHSSGPTGMILPGEYDHAEPLVRSLAYEQSSCADAAYLATVERGIVDAVCRADRSRAAARCGVGRGVEGGVSFNRRFRMKDGLTYTHPGQGNPDIVEPAGPIDPEVGVLGVWDAAGRLVGCVVNFACHATTSPGGISANYIYYLEQVIRGAFGDHVVVVFLPGASGDVTQVDNLSPAAHPDGERWARLVGGSVGAEAVKVLLRMEAGALTPLGARSSTVAIKRRAPAPERLGQSRDIVRSGVERAGHTAWTFAKEIVLLDALIAKTPVREFEIQAVQVGPAVFLGNPAEAFCALGLAIKRQSPFPFTFPVTFANDCIGYVPTAEAFGEHGGGYETRLTSYSNLETAAGQRIVETSVELARALSPGPVPTPPPPRPFAAPWSYGNVPPELK